MKGNQKIIDALNGLLAMELAAMDQYFIPLKCTWIGDCINCTTVSAMNSMMRKAMPPSLLSECSFSVPDMVTRDGFKVGSDIKSMLESDLRVEYEVASRLRSAIALCEQERDFVTKDALVPLLDDTKWTMLTG